MKLTAIKIVALLLSIFIGFSLNSILVFEAEAAGVTYYVDQEKGNDSFDGRSEVKAFKQLQRGLSQALAGDTVAVKNGTYTRDGGSLFFFKYNGLPDKYITLKNYPGHRPKLTANAWCVFCMDGRSYIRIQGFEITNTSVRGDRIDGAGGGIGLNKGAHHIKIENNIIHDTGGSGIVANNADYITIHNNTIYKTSRESIWGASGINLNHNSNFDAHLGNGYSNLITNNVVYANEQTRPSNCTGCGIVDGNGIILDKFNEGIPYTGRTLIANNLVVQNGGRGINIYRSVNADIVNNTLFKNNFRLEITDGELVVNASKDIRIYNNLIQSRDEKHCGFVTGNTNLIHDHNLCYSKKHTYYLSEHSIQAEPRFVNPSSVKVTIEGFRPIKSSIVVDAGGLMPFVNWRQLTDLAGKNRVSGDKVDIGALEYQD